MPSIENSVLQHIQFSEIEKVDVSLSILREDLIHPQISGNKFRKLKYNILQAQKESKRTLLTFGGAFSNHIAAVAAAGKHHGLKTVGVIRGDELGNNLVNTLSTNVTLKFAYRCGMQFKFVSRSEYREKETTEFLQKLQKEFKDCYVIPEGGTNEPAIKGCEEILDSKTEKFDYICVAVGTGGTISGLIRSAKEHQTVLGFPALKGDFLKGEIEKHVGKKDRWNLISDYHFGGYAKTSQELIEFINRFKDETKIQLDPVYTGKMTFGIINLIKDNYFKKGSRLLIIHTGGLQGIEGMNAILRRRNSLILK
jgi:1-aminocyclopropane-1-carboxylate deaminase